ncbi:hypothetical protein O6H91_09G123600 [Diphasiastrum complanatum]|uniref:Uncharacterized protein n=1 Tax=Diphasiastrum complanatum TaxID=34168 RepID=A0ACC2CUG7_DIPCM|nr:hypothetical protein O6H91_09G123600 [Diphasiastrum complanatum]
MRTVCDMCEAGPAHVFCAADEAALCLKCDEKVHGCNNLASKHVRVQLAEARCVSLCNICESAPAFFFCGIDGTSLCLQCDLDAHTDGKRTHERYLVMGQKVESPAQKLGPEKFVLAKALHECNSQHFKHKKEAASICREWNNSHGPAVAIAVSNVDMEVADHQDSLLIDLNSKV